MISWVLSEIGLNQLEILLVLNYFETLGRSHRFETTRLQFFLLRYSQLFDMLDSVFFCIVHESILCLESWFVTRACNELFRLFGWVNLRAKRTLLELVHYGLPLQNFYFFIFQFSLQHSFLVQSITNLLYFWFRSAFGLLCSVLFCS